MGLPAFFLGGILGAAAYYAIATDNGRKNAGAMWRAVKEDMDGITGETADKQPEGDGEQHAPDKDK